MFKQVVPWLIAGYALWRWGQYRRQPNGRSTPAELMAWEGEGGALPDAAQAIGSELPER
jgi:hypothetical protein